MFQLLSRKEILLLMSRKICLSQFLTVDAVVVNNHLNVLPCSSPCWIPSHILLSNFCLGSMSKYQLSMATDRSAVFFYYRWFEAQIADSINTLLCFHPNLCPELISVTFGTRVHVQIQKLCLWCQSPRRFVFKNTCKYHKVWLANWA